MRPGASVLAVAITLAAAVPVEGDSQVLTGVVTAADSGEPLPQTAVMEVGPEGVAQTVATGRDGRYRLNLKGAGPFRVRAERLGYATYDVSGLEVEEGETLEFDIALVPRPVQLPEIAAEVELRPRRWFWAEISPFGVVHRDRPEECLYLIANGYVLKDPDEIWDQLHRDHTPTGGHVVTAPRTGDPSRIAYGRRILRSPAEVPRWFRDEIWPCGAYVYWYGIYASEERWPPNFPREVNTNVRPGCDGVRPPWWPPWRDDPPTEHSCPW